MGTRRSRRQGTSSASRRSPTPCSDPSVAQFGAAARHELLELLPQCGVHGRLLVALECRLPDGRRACRAVAAPVPRPALEVLRAREQRPVEAVAEALERVRRTQEVAAVADLLV